ncbi:MAG: bifunctional phosphopantothenoylcysteine decarboxylase/phosphopantothenate--cysteine ligase CoaBC [Pyrodictiaceae archaeon]
MAAEFWGELHPSWQIIGTREGDLAGYCIVLGVTGGAAIYKSIDLARLLMRFGAKVRVVMTKEATRLVSPTLFEWATGMPAITELSGMIEHVALAEHCDAMVIAPATLDTMAEIASCRASTPVSATAQEFAGRGKRVLLVPAMHAGMWVRAKSVVAKLEEQGFYVMRPLLEEERAKYPSVDHVAWWVETVATRGQDLKDQKVVVTAGATREYIDPVRIITNPSSGLMGVSLALEALWRGAEVLLVHGHVSVNVPRLEGLKRKFAETSSDMAEALAKAMERFKPSMAFYAAAVADYRPKKTSSTKIPTEQGELVLRLEPTPKVIPAAMAARPEALHVGFAAETVSSDEELLSKARLKLEKYKLDMVAANNISEEGVGFAAETNRLLVVSWRGKVWSIPRMHKRRAARRLIDISVRMLRRGELRSRST